MLMLDFAQCKIPQYKTTYVGSTNFTLSIDTSQIRLQPEYSLLYFDLFITVTLLLKTAELILLI